VLGGGSSQVCSPLVMDGNSPNNERYAAAKTRTFAEDSGAYLTIALGWPDGDGEWLIALRDDGSCRLDRRDEPIGHYRTLWEGLQAIAPTDCLVAA
jgi:hypothetical protein